MQKSKKIWIIAAVFVMLIATSAYLINKSYGKFVSGFFTGSPGNINILVLGRGGVGHEAPDLTDTIIVAIISDNRTNLVSLPRDLWIAGIRAKINSAYFWGKEKGSNFTIADESVKVVTGITINNNLIIDFSVFKEVVDAIGGIEVDVENSFTDYKYPIAGKEADLCEGDKTFACRYETVNFEKGNSPMNGETALKFVRSRNAEGTEGTDIAREARQQLVISAIKNKVLSPQVMLSLGTVKKLWRMGFGSIETDIDQKTAGLIARKIVNSGYSLSSHAFPEHLLLNPPALPRYDRQYVFVPKKGDGDWSEIIEWFTSL